MPVGSAATCCYPFDPKFLCLFAPFKGLPKNICRAEDIRVVIESFYEESNECQRSHQT